MTHYGERPNGPKSATRLAMLLRKHKAKQELDQMLLGKPLSPTDLVFSNPDDNPLRPNTVTRAFERLARSLGFQGIRFHDLRHAHATLMLRQGIHPRIVSERLGHSSVAITLDTYSHVLFPVCKKQRHTDLRRACKPVRLRPRQLRFVSKMLAILPFSTFLEYNLKLGEVSEWFMVPLSKFAFRCPKQCFYVQIRTFVLIGRRAF